MSMSWADLGMLALKATAFVAMALGASYIWSFIAPGLGRLLTAAAMSFWTATRTLANSTLGWFRARFRAYLAGRRCEPAAPIAAALDHVADAVQDATAVSARALQDLERNLRRDLVIAERLTPGTALNELVAAKAVDDPLSGGTSVWAPLSTVAAAAVVGIFNATLLNIFFRELLGPIRLLPYPMPDLQLSQVLGVIFFLLEIFVGHLLGQAREIEDDTRTSLFVAHLIPWFGLAALVLVEIFAYATLSQQIDLASRLQVSSESPMYDVAQYFLAFLGAAITMILAGLGYVATRQWQAYRKSASQRHLLAAIKAQLTAVSTHRERLEDVAASLEHVKRAVTDFPTDIRQRAAEGMGSPEAHTDVVRQIAERVSSLQPRTMPEESAPYIRTVSQVFTELGLQLLFAVLIVLGLCAAYFLYFTLLATGGTVPSSYVDAVAGAMALSIVALGWMLREAHLGGKSANAVRRAALRHDRRRIWAILAGSGLIVAGMLTAAGSASIHLLGPYWLVSALYGLALVLVIGLLGGLLDQIVTGVFDAAWLGAIAGAWVIARLLFLGGEIVKLLLLAVKFVSDLLAAPGGWMRRDVARA